MPTVAVLTSGGDSPGMNSVIYSFSCSAILNNWNVLYVQDGYNGLLKNQIKQIPLIDIKNSIFTSGSYIGSSRCLEFQNSAEARQKACDNLKACGVDVLVVIGGNGSYQGAELLYLLGFPVIVIPGTIDNDVASSQYTVGFFSALEEIFHASRKIKATSNSHTQVTFLEVMGRDCSDLTVFAGVAANIDYSITNKNPKTVDELYEIITEIKKSGEKGIVILVSEKIYGQKFGFNLPELSEITSSLEKKLNLQVRSAVLGHLQRGAYPNSWELFVASGFGKFAFNLVKEKTLNVAVGYDGQKYYFTSLTEANKMKKTTHLELLNFQNLIFQLK